MYDIIIVGAGTAGIAAYKEAIKKKDNILIITTTLEVENLDENELMNVIINFEDAIEKAIVTLKNYYVDDLELNEGEVSGIY